MSSGASMNPREIVKSRLEISIGMGDNIFREIVGHRVGDIGIISIALMYGTARFLSVKDVFIRVEQHPSFVVVTIVTVISFIVNGWEPMT